LIKPGTTHLNGLASNILTDILYGVTRALASTGWKDNFIAPEIFDAGDIVKGFTDDDLREWMDGVQKGLKHFNWESLLEHRV
jgi:hypothetical protein